MRLLIAPDSCVFIAGIHLRSTTPNYPEVQVVNLAELRVFDVLLVSNVEDEVREALREYSKEEEFDAFCKMAHIKRCPGPTLEEKKKHERKFVAKLRHLNDVPIAIAIMLSTTQPDIFVSSNTEHWKPNLSSILGGVEVMTPKQLLGRLLRPG